MAQRVHLHVERMGEGDRSLLVLHGWGRSLQSLKPLGELLSSQYDVHCIDLPGFGQSGFPDGVWGTRDYAQRLLSYCDEQGLKQVDCLGHSFGGKVALGLAGLYPHRVGRLILIASSGLRRRHSWPQRCRLQAIRWLGRAVHGVDALCGVEWFENYFAPRYGSRDYKSAGALRPTFVKAVNEDLGELIPSIRSEALLLWGERDGETPPEIAHRLQALLPRSALRLFPGRDHYLFEDVGAHLCAAHILEWLQEH